MKIEAAYERASRQSFIALKNAFHTIHQFAEPTLDPDSYAEFERIERLLIKTYVQDVKTLAELYGDAFEADAADELIAYARGLT